MDDKKVTIIVCSICIVLVLLQVFFALKPPKPEVEVIKTQEDIQMDIINRLQTMCLLVHQDISSASGEYQLDFLAFLRDMNVDFDSQAAYTEMRPRAEIAPGIEIFTERLALYTHFFTLFGHTESIITPEEIAMLYKSNDEELEEKFKNLYRLWGGYNTSGIYIYYEDAMRVAYALYMEQYGAFSGKDAYGKMLTEDKISLGQFIRDNPEFMPKEVYYIELYNLYIIGDDEYRALRKTVENAQK